MHYVIAGQGEPVVLIHGLFGNFDNLKSLGSSLEDKFKVIRVDVPNHGVSPHWHTMDYNSLADAFITLLDSLNIESAHFVGHSMGGKIAMAIALKYPEHVKSLVVADIAPVAYQPRHDIVFNGLTSLDLTKTDRKSALQHLVHSGIDEPTAQFLLKNLQRSDNGFEWKMNLTGLISAYPDIIGWPFAHQQYQGPCFMIRGGDSDYVKAEHRESILAQFPNITAKTLYGTGHWLHAQKPEIFNRLIGEFLTSQSMNKSA